MGYTRRMDTPLLDLALAREIELAEGEAAVACAKMRKALQAESDSAVEAIAGGYAVYCGANSPVTQAVGLGLNGPVSKEEFDRLEEFYFSRKRRCGWKRVPWRTQRCWNTTRSGDITSANFQT